MIEQVKLSKKEKLKWQQNMENIDGVQQIHKMLEGLEENIENTTEHNLIINNRQYIF